MYLGMKVKGLLFLNIVLVSFIYISTWIGGPFFLIGKYCSLCECIKFYVFTVWGIWIVSSILLLQITFQ